MSYSRFQRIFIIAGILSLFAAYVAWWFRFINDPVERTGSDFIAFYAAGRVAQEYGFSRVFEPELQQAVQQEVVGFPLVEGQVLLHNHPPLLPPLLRLLFTPNYVQSFYRWVFLLIAIYIGSLIVLSKLLEHSEMERRTILLIAVSAFLFLPLYFSLMNGQDTPIIFMGAAIWLYGLTTGKEWLAGFGLSLTVMRPHISLALAIPMIFRYRKAFFGYVLGSSFLVVLAILINGLDGMQKYIDILLISAGGEWHGMREESMVNLLGLMLRILGPSAADIIRPWGWVIFAASIVGLAYLWSRKSELPGNLVGLTVIVTLFTTPHLHLHDLTLLLIPFYELVRSGYLKNFAAIAFPIAASLLLLLSNITPILQFNTPYLLMLVLAIYSYLSKERPTITAPRRS
jgi:hypothetical protein